MNESRPESMASFWMPFTNNRDFKAHPRLLVSAEGMYYKDVDGNSILDGTAGLWCVPCGHAQPKIVAAVREMVGQLDFAPTFQMGHPAAFDLAEKLMEYTNHRFGHVFYTNSGSEAVDTALKMALAYHKARGEAGRTRLIGRERGYHGVGFGGISVGGIAGNRKQYTIMLPGVDHLPHTHNLEKNAYTRGEPEYGTELADELERIVALHDASTVAAVIVEPVAGSTGVLIPPKGYLKRLRELCTKHGILLIFDEVITGFGRLTTPFAADYFDVEPDMMTTAKGLTNGVIPMGAVFSKKHIHDAFMDAPAGIELFHGYTYSGHPVACAASLATLEVFREQNILEHAAGMAEYWADAVHSLKGLPHVIDIRTIGLIAGIELAPIPGKPGVRAFTAFKQAFADGILIRTTGDTIALSPPLVLEKKHIDELFGKLTTVLKTWSERYKNEETIMLVGVPKEIKNQESRVGLTPASVKELVLRGHQVLVQKDAGAAIGLTDAMYEGAGAEIVDNAPDIFARAGMIVKVKEPQPAECAMLRREQILYTYLHLAPDAEQTRALVDSGAVCIAYETITGENGGLPLLAPMSEVAGRMSIQAGAAHLEKSKGGMGLLLGGVPGVAPGHIAIIGAGVVGTNALQMAVGIGARVTVLDKNIDRLRQLDLVYGNRISTMFSSAHSIEQAVLDADLVIGGVLVPGAAAPKLVTRSMISRMKAGAVVVDVAIDQGGCFETSRATTHQEPTFVVDDVVHYCVANMPGAVARTSTFALNNATIVHALALADKGWQKAMKANAHLKNGLNVCQGHVTYAAVAHALGYPYVDADGLLG